VKCGILKMALKSDPDPERRFQIPHPGQVANNNFEPIFSANSSAMKDPYWPEFGHGVELRWASPSVA
jgi:hypothetical protein